MGEKHVVVRFRKLSRKSIGVTEKITMNRVTTAGVQVETHSATPK
jgi:hypothetical protein